MGGGNMHDELAGELHALWSLRLHNILADAILQADGSAWLPPALMASLRPLLQQTLPELDEGYQAACRQEAQRLLRVILGAETVEESDG